MDSVIEWGTATARVKVALRDGLLDGERFLWNGQECGMDGNFLLDLVWSDWRAPDKNNNGDNECVLDRNSFRFAGQALREGSEGEEWVLRFHGPDVGGFYRPKAPLELDLVYRMDGDRGYFRRRLELRDPNANGHLLHGLSSYSTQLDHEPGILKAGGFGQPAAWLRGGNRAAGGGAFFGVEWPAAHISLAGRTLSTRQEMGEVLGESSLCGEWTILGLTSDKYIKHHFFEYLETIRAAPARPYTLYNTWYDLRTSEYRKRLPDIGDGQIMNEENVLRLAGEVQDRMCRDHGIELDAFVLDDGWDVYQSAWELRAEEFPRGLAPVSGKLEETSTRLGVWFGPTGGYSFRKTRTDWFRANGYEVSSNDMMSISGPRYAALFEKRVCEMVEAGASYFKWDGLQFVCNDAYPGLKTGLYARRQGLLNLKRIADKARALDKDMYLNITSGTWLSPWWLAIADQIWMDGNDFGSADIGSVSTRDSSITYRDLVLDEDFRLKDLWFPMSGLMTHGVLKGSIDVGDIGRNEPLAKFADEMMFYLARGVSMYELYLSPSEIREEEWRVLAASLRWARDRFPLLSATAWPVGGDIRRGEAYGYAHWKGQRGIVSFRNPGMEPRTCRLELDAAQGLDPAARQLVVQWVYPGRWTSPRLYKAGDSMEVSLCGYEAAVYEIRPLSEAGDNVLAGLCYDEDEHGRLLPLAVRGALVMLDGNGGKPLEPAMAAKLRSPAEKLPVVDYSHRAFGATLELSLEPAAGVMEPQLAIFARPGVMAPEPKSGSSLPAPRITMAGVALPVDAVADEKGAWAWYTVALADYFTEKAELSLDLSPLGSREEPWEGSLEIWVLGDVKTNLPMLDGRLSSSGDPRPMPPLARVAGSLPVRQLLLGIDWKGENAKV